MRDVNVLKHLPWLVLFFLWIAGTLLWLLFVNEQQAQVKVAFRTQLERLGDQLLRSRLEGQLGPDSLPEGVRTFGVYGPRGNLVAAWGSQAPIRIEATFETDAPGGQLFLSDRGWIEYVKLLEPLRRRMDFWNEDRSANDKPMMPPKGMPPRKSQGYLFLRVSDAPLETRLWAWTIGGALGSVAWAGFVVFVGLLWFRTRRYQAALVQNRELLQFAEASRTLGHELQNPLAAILLQTALLKRTSGDPPAVEVSIIEEEARRMSALVARVRDFLKDPQGQAETVNLEELVSSLKERFSVAVSMGSDGTGPYQVSFDPHRLRSVVENLMKNAVESGSDPRPSVHLSRPRAGWIRMEVVDSGTGFTPESLRRSVNPFFTTKTTGTGIGLSIVDGFVRAAGGRLKLENRPEGGARVTVDFAEAAKEVSQ